MELLIDKLSNPPAEHQMEIPAEHLTELLIEKLQNI